MTLRALRVDYHRHIERRNKSQIPSRLLCDNMPVGIRMTYDKDVLHGNIPKVAAIGTGSTKDTRAFARRSSSVAPFAKLKPSDFRRSFPDLSIISRYV